MARRKYPSDHRPYFRVLEDILHDPKLNTDDPHEDALVLSTFMRLLAVLNQRSSQDGRFTLDTSSACWLTRRRYAGTARELLGKCEVRGLLALDSVDGSISGRVHNWAKIQGFAPAKLRRDSGETPAPRVEEKREQTPSESDAALAASVERALHLLAREPGSRDAKKAWMARELPLLLAEAERMEPADKKARSAAFRGLVIRYWRQHNGRRLEVRHANGPGTSDLAERARAALRARAAAAGSLDGAG